MKNQQRGFINAYLLAAVMLLGLVASYIAAAERGFLPQWLSTRSADVYADQLIKSGKALHKAATYFWQENPAQATLLLDDSAQGLYSPQLSLLPAQFAPPGATQTREAVPFVAEGSTLKTNPSGAAPDLVVAVPDLSDAVCKRINARLHADIQLDPIAAGKLEGCGRIRLACKAQASNVYFKVVMPLSSLGGPAAPSPNCQ